MMEKRIYPRVARQFSAIIANDDGLQLRVEGMDASSEGVCIQCNTVVRNILTPGGSFVRDGKPVELFVSLELPFDEHGAEMVDARCHVAFSRRLSNDQCRIGMRFMDLDQKGYETLIQYIESALASNDN